MTVAELHSPFWEWTRDLPDAIARSADRDMPIVVPDPCTEHGRRLMRTLGAYLAEFQIERLKPMCGAQLANWLDEWKALKADGWDVTVLLDRSDQTVIAMASRIVRA